MSFGLAVYSYSWVLACEIYSTQLILFMNFSHFIVEPSKFLLGYFWGLFLVLIRFVPGGVHWVIGPMTPPWYKMNNQQNLPIWFLKTPGTNEPGYRAKFARLDDEILRRIHTKHVDWQPRITCLNSRNACPRKTTWHRRTLKSTLHPIVDSTWFVPPPSREKIWREKLFLGLVQNESKAIRLISICT